jgi:hypothetical protein
MTINDLRNFLNKLPDSFNCFDVVSSDKCKIDDNYCRFYKLISSMLVDENTKELVLNIETEND